MGFSTRLAATSLTVNAALGLLPQIAGAPVTLERMSIVSGTLSTRLIGAVVGALT